MSSAALPPVLQRFIRRWVYSVEQLEILCLLSSSPQRSWSTTEVYAIIQSSESSISKNMQDFARERLLEIETDGTYRLARGQRDLTPVLTKLAQVYRERRVSLIKFIYEGGSNAESSD